MYRVVKTELLKKKKKKLYYFIVDSTYTLFYIHPYKTGGGSNSRDGIHLIFIFYANI